MAAPRAPRVCVVGGGVTGLTAAHTLVRTRPDVQLTVLEAGERLGGNIVTDRCDGFLIDAGPDSFLRTKPDAVALCQELGLENDLVTTRPEARKVYVVHEGRLEQMPAGMELAVPTRVGPMLRTPLLSLAGKLRLLREPLVGAGGGDSDESIEAFLTRRLGAEAVRNLAGPLLGSIFAGDVSKLSVQSTFPQLVAMERQHGSLVRGLMEAARGARGDRAGGLLAWMIRSAAEAPSPFYSLRRGMGSLIEALARSLPEGSVRTGCAATQIEPVPGYDGRFLVEVDAAEPVVADAIALTTPAHVASRLLGDEALRRELAKIPYVSTATVFFGFERRSVEHSLDGLGFIAPSHESRLLAATWVSSKWEGRAPDDHVLIRGFLGGTRARDLVPTSSDEELARLAKAELTRLMGALGEPVLTRVYRYVDKNPLPVVGHAERIARIGQRLATMPGLYLAGAAYDGVGIPDCVRQGRALAERLVHRIA